MNGVDFFMLFAEIVKNVDPIVKLLMRLSSWWGWLAEVSIGAIIVRLLLAVICGGIIGGERAAKRHAAGFRTYIIVAVGAAIAGATNQFIFEFFGNTGDGARLGAQVISGIGFLCAGTILVTSRSQIKGLTTAAGLWACGCMGLSVGLGYYTMGIVSALMLLIILSVLPPIENYFILRAKIFSLHVELSSRPDLKELINYLRKHEYSVTNVEHNIAYASSGLSVYTLTITMPDVKKGKRIINHNEVAKILETLPYVNHAEVIQ